MFAEGKSLLQDFAQNFSETYLLRAFKMPTISNFSFITRHCLRVQYRTSRLRGYGSGTGHLDTDSRGPVPDTEPRLWGLSRGLVVCETTTDKSRDTGPYLHVYVVTVILPTKTHVEDSLCFVHHLWSSKGNQSVFTVMRHTIQTIKLIQKVYGKVKKKELNSPVTNQLSSHLQLKEPIKLFVGSWLMSWVSSVK